MNDDINATPEITEISYGSAVFRHIDRILSLSNKDFQSSDMKLITFASAVRLLVALIPKEMRTTEFNNEINNIKDNKSAEYQERFETIEKKFSLCINLLADKGYLYRKVAEGTYEN